MPDALTFTVLRLLSDSQFRSAAALAAELGVPRGAVANAIQHLDALGVDLVRAPGQGYRLAAPSEWLDAAAVRSHLGVHAALFNVQVVDIATSTNTLLLESAAAGAPSGSVLTTDGVGELLRDRGFVNVHPLPAPADSNAAMVVAQRPVTSGRG